jgi:hypothetical protein
MSVPTDILPLLADLRELEHHRDAPDYRQAARRVVDPPTHRRGR